MKVELSKALVPYAVRLDAIATFGIWILALWVGEGNRVYTAGRRRA